MILSDAYLQLVSRIQEALPLPAVRSLYLPSPQQDEFRDEFGFVFLETGDVGAFYVSLEDSLPALRQEFPAPQQAKLPLKVLLDRLGENDPASRALGLGAFNALSQYVMRIAGYEPENHRNHDKRIKPPPPVDTVGMVGYFCPIVERLTSQGVGAMVLEMLPERVTPHPLVQVTTDPEDLAMCDQVLCTASTLINGTLDDILAACGNVPDFSLIGPSAGGLPDVVFSRGVQEVGATAFPDSEMLQDLLARGESWGKAGRKYRIRQEEYPGVEALLERAAATLPHEQRGQSNSRRGIPNQHQ